MRRFKNLLVCVQAKNESHPALERAAVVARLNEAAVKIVAVHEELPTWASTLLPAKVRDWERLAMEESEARLRALGVPLQEQGLAISTRVLAGQPFVEVIREAVSGGHDLVLKDMDVDSAPDTSGIGSTDMHLLRKCPVPVWIVRPDSGKGFARILAAVDPLPGEDEPADSVNVQVLELATSLARQENCKLFIVRVYESIGQQFEVPNMDAGEHAEYSEHIQMVRVRNDREFIGKFAGAGEQFDVRYLFGNPDAMIAEVAREDAVDLIVMGTVMRSGIPGLLMGRTAENVLRQVDCSILGVKPSGFISPV